MLGGAQLVADAGSCSGAARQQLPPSQRQQRRRPTAACCPLPPANEPSSPPQAQPASLMRRRLLAAVAGGLSAASLPQPASASKLPEAVDRAWEGLGGGPADLVFPGRRRGQLVAGWFAWPLHNIAHPWFVAAAAGEWFSCNYPQATFLSRPPAPADQFLGVWDVESVLRRVDLPLGPELVPDMRVSGWSGLRVAWACCLGAACRQMPSVGAARLCAAAARCGATTDVSAWALPPFRWCSERGRKT